MDLRIRLPLLVSLVLFLTVIGGGTLGYMWIEGWRWLDAMWMVIITLTTIGFGEIHPLSDAGRIFTLVLIMTGVSVGTYTMTQITSLVVEGAMSEAWTQRSKRRQVERLKNHFIVVGFGRLGEAIAEELCSSNVPICVVEREPDSVKRLEELNICPYVVGDGADDDVLRKAGIERATGIAVAVSSSAEAVFVTLSARQLNPNLNIVTRVSDAEHAVKARRAGANSVVSPHMMGGWRMAHGLIRPHATSFLDLATLARHNDVRVEEYEIPQVSQLAGRTLRQLSLSDRFSVLVVAIRRADGTIVATPRANERLEKGDVLIVFGTPAAVANFRAQAETQG